MFWSKAIPTKMENYILFENQLLCYWVLAWIECLNRKHSITMKLELPVMRYILLDLPSQKFGQAQQVQFTPTFRPREVLPLHSIFPHVGMSKTIESDVANGFSQRFAVSQSGFAAELFLPLYFIHIL